MKIVVYNDVHAYSPYEIYSGIGLVSAVKAEPDRANTYLIGDNTDMKNCKKSDVVAAQATRTMLKLMLPGHYLPGNHSLEPICLSPPELETVTIQVGTTLLMHGDILFWGYEKAQAWRTGHAPGASWFMRLMSQWLDEIRMVAPVHYNDDFYARCHEYADQHGCKTIIMGHHHPKVRLDTVHNGLRVVCLMRGRNEVEI